MMDLGANGRLRPELQQLLATELPVLQLPADYARQAAEFSEERIAFEISDRIYEEAATFAARADVELFELLFAVFQTLMFRYSEQEDLLTGFVRESEPLAYVRSVPAGELAFADWLNRVDAHCAAAKLNTPEQIERAAEQLGLAAGKRPEAVCQAVLVYGAGNIRPLAAAGKDMVLYLTEDGSRLYGEWVYNANLFAAQTVERMIGHYRCLLESSLERPDTPLAQLNLLSAAEREALLAEELAMADDARRSQAVHHLFEEQAARTPDRIAVEYAGQTLTYRELNERANRLAHHLRGLGIGREKLVGLCVERSLELIVGVLGILKAGGAYVPLDPDYPQERTAYILDDTKMQVMVTQQPVAAKLPELTCQLVCLDADWEQIAAHQGDNPADQAAASDMAYMIYTSGSTGRPKAVIVEHGSLSSVLVTSGEAFNFTESDVMPWIASVAFDIALFELMHPLLKGGRTVVLDREHALDLPRLITDLEQYTAIHTVPSLMRQIVQTIREEGRDNSNYDDLRIIFIGGDAVAPDLLEAMYEVFQQAQIHVLYGPTEGTIICAHYPVPRGTALGKFHIGRPFSHASLRLYDPHGNLVPNGLPGELYIGGAAVSRGYYGRNDLTAEKYVQVDGQRWYRSGDLMRRMADGTLEFLGRIDNQVKIRGYRVELGEIESVLAQHEAVEEAIVVVRAEPSGEKRLVGYVVGNCTTGAELSRELTEQLKAKLPGYMVPAAILVLDSMPLNPNGKVDRKLLPEPDWSREEADFVAPRGMMEQIVADVWAQVFGLERIGATDHFFELGGHSLLATQVISRLRRLLSVELTQRCLFEAPTVELLAKRIREREGRKETVAGIEKMSRDGRLPLSFAQQRLLFFDQLEPGNPMYNLASALRLRGTLNLSALERALHELCERHESLRTTFREQDGEPCQVIAANTPFRLPVEDHSSCEAAARDQLAQVLSREEAHKPFDLQNGPLFRARLITFAPEDHLLIFNMHHIISDGWSLAIFRRELSAFYEAFSQDTVPALAELPVQYADYSQWHNESLQGAGMDKQMAYWEEQLSGTLPILQIPTDRSRPHKQTYNGKTLRFQLTERLTEQIKDLSRKEGTTLYMTLLAAFQTLLYRYSGQTDLLIGSPVVNRQLSELEHMIGFFVNTIVLRADFSQEPTFRELLAQARDSSLGAFANQDVPFEQLVAKLAPERSMSHAPLVQVMFSFENFDQSVMTMPGLTVQPLDFDLDTAKFDLTLFMGESESGKLYARLEYNTDLFDLATIERMQESLIALLQGAVADPSQSTAKLPVMSTTQRAMLLEGWNQTATPYPSDRSIQELFEEQAAKTPDAVAVVFAEEQLTYAQLNVRANRLARRLQALGVKPETAVGVCLERSAELVVALLAIVKAGGLYVPLDPNYPQERLAFMLEDADLLALVTTSALAERLPEHSAALVCLDLQAEAIAAQSGENPANTAGPDNLIYVIYTSGSTGRPKGVCVTHRSVARLVKETNYVRFTEEEVFLQFAPISFDAATFEIWGALLNGGRLVVFPSQKPSLEELGRVIRRYEVTTLFLTTALFHQMIETRWEDLVAVRQLLAGGEQMSVAHVRDVFARSGGWQFYHVYGPTETTTFATACLIQDASQLEASVPIGKALSNTTLYVLDKHLQPVPVGVPGELYIGGDGVARGYLNRPELTEEKFVTNPFGEGRLYRTGDLVRWLCDGNIEFLGRLDHQVKVRGFRIELGEIEVELGKHEKVSETVAIVREDVPGDKRLTAYVVPHEGQDITAGELRSYLAEKMPEYMIPSAFEVMDKLPLTANGKIDRQKLPKPGVDRGTQELVLPRNEQEQQIAAIWQEILGVEQVGVHDNFFELGGHSLLATQVISRLRQVFGIELPLRLMFEARTIDLLAAEARALQAAKAPVKKAPGLMAVSRAAYRQNGAQVTNELGK
ncbi:non-ribosomal peptide synthetase [Tumebacillus avium]|nr:non-ribosomal peptide synthetase [Tumebacillus avium]